MKILKLILILLLLAGCTAAPAVTPTGAASSPGASTAYPGGAPSVPAATSYPIQYDLPTLAPQDPNLGRVEGTLLLNGKPVFPADLWLIDLIKDSKGTEVAAQFDRSVDPRAATDQNGKFVFVNVKPGRHSLMMEIYPIAYVMLKPNATDALIVVVQPTGVTSLGTLNYSDLPGPKR